MFPLDTLKTRLQSPDFQKNYRNATAIANRALWRNLYQGVGTLLLVTVPSSGVFFTTYEGLKYALGSSSTTGTPGILPQPAVHALSSSIAQLINCAVVTPAEVLKQNAQVLAAPASSTGDKKKASSSPTMQVLRQMKRNPTKLWAGYTALAARDLPFTALQFPAYEYLKGVLIERQSRLRERSEPVNKVLERAWVSAVSGGVAGSAAAWVTTPLDVIKTRMMLEAGAKGSHQAERKRGSRRSAFQIGKEVFQNEGIRGLFRGGAIRATFTIFGNGLFIGCYEGAKVYLQSSNDC